MWGRTWGPAVSLVFVVAAMAGCLGADERGASLPEADAGLAPPAVPRTIVHAPGADLTIDAEDEALVDLLAQARGAARYIGLRSFEPTVGVASDGAVFMSAFGNGRGAQVGRSLDKGLTWSDVSAKIGEDLAITGITGSPPPNNPPNSNDPYIYVDPATDRLFSIDLQALLCASLGWSDDQGESWFVNYGACGLPPGVHDHQTMVAAKPRETETVGYASLLYYCVNRVIDSVCATSTNGGLSFGPLIPVFPGLDPERADPDFALPAGFCGGLHGHVVAAPDGVVYLPKGQCGVPMVGVTGDDGLTWDLYAVSETVRISGHELRLAVDDEGTVYAFWQGADGLPYLAFSQTEGTTWSEPLMVGFPGLTGMDFPSIAAGAAGHVAFAYVGTNYTDPYNLNETHDAEPETWGENRTWNGYIGVITDATSPTPTVVTVTAHDPLDPIGRGFCGRGRCPGNGDFLDIVIDVEGRPWAAFVDACNDECALPNGTENQGGGRGFVGTLETGPSLRMPGALLEPLPVPDLDMMSWDGDDEPARPGASDGDSGSPPAARPAGRARTPWRVLGAA